VAGKCTLAYTYTHARTHTHAHTQAHTHTHTYLPELSLCNSHNRRTRTCTHPLTRKQASNTHGVCDNDFPPGEGAGEGAVAPNVFRGTFTKDLRVMQYGYGDDESPLQETVSYVTQGLGELCKLHNVTQRLGSCSTAMEVTNRHRKRR